MRNMLRDDDERAAAWRESAGFCERFIRVLVPASNSLRASLCGLPMANILPASSPMGAAILKISGYEVPEMT